MLGFNATGWFFLLLAYVLGSIPFGFLLMRFSGRGDVRAQGSGNIGATNVTRVGGKKLGLITFLLDAGKGVAAVLLARYFSGDEIAEMAAFTVVLGHVFPVFLKFHGGKGVATTVAVLATLSPVLGGSVAAVWLAVFAITRISSLSAILAMIAAPSIAFCFVGDTGYQQVYITLLLSTLVIARHHTNIRRLIAGEEKSF